MADASDNTADRLDDVLNDERIRPTDDLDAFASRLLRDAALPSAPTEPTRAQRGRIRARVFESEPSKARTPVQPHPFAANGSSAGSIPAPQPAVPETRQRPSWLSVLATAALVALVAIAAFGVLRGSFDFTSGGNDDPEPRMAPALAYSPVASPETVATCDRDQWVTVFDGAVPSILQNTTHATLSDGTLTWRCGEEREELATGVRDASGAFWPGVIALVTEHDDVRLLNVASNTELDLDPSAMLTEDGSIDYRDGFARSGGPEPWVVTPVGTDHNDWRIIDLRSMDSFLLSDESGAPDPASHYPVMGYVTGTDVAVVTWREEGFYLPGTPISNGAGVGGVEVSRHERALVLPGTIEDRRWIDHVTYGVQSTRQIGTSQVSTVNPDGSLIAYATLTDTFAPAIRVEDTVTGEHFVDVPIDGIDPDTRFILGGDGDDPHLAVANGDTVRYYGLVQGASRPIAEQPGPDIEYFLPTADPNIVLLSHNNGGTSVTPVNVTDPTALTEFYNYVPPVWTQVFGDDELPQYIVRVGSESPSDKPAVVKLVNVSTLEVVLESDPVDAHPIQIVSFDAHLRDGGELAVVPIGYNRAVVLDAASGETWQIEAPIDDDRLWRFFLSYDGRFITAYPEPPTGTTGIDKADAWVAELEPNPTWVPFEGAPDDASIVAPATPTG